MRTLLSIFFVIVGIVPVLLNACTDTCTDKGPTEFMETEQIVSISFDSSGFSGSFFLGCGTIGTEDYFYTYIKRGKGFNLKKYRASICTIYEDGNNNPYIRIWYKEVYDVPELDRTYLKIDFHVPKGTIVREFKL